MVDYRELAIEAVITLSVVADFESGDFDKRLASRANTLAMKLGILDLEAEKAEPENKTQKKPKPVELPKGPTIEEEPPAASRAAAVEDDGSKVIVLPKPEPKPLPNEHTLNLKGIGPAGKPVRRFRMREKGSAAWFEGTASECARKFSTQTSLIYKWANGMKSQKFELEKI